MMINNDIHIGLLEDDKYMSSVIKNFLQKNPLWKVTTYLSPEDIQFDNLPDIMIFDYFMGSSTTGNTSEEALKKIKLINPELPVIFFTSSKDINTALKVLFRGAEDYIVKDINNFQKLKNSIEETIKTKNRLEELKIMRKELKETKRKIIVYGSILLGLSVAISMIV